jgi:hypothetical protein
MAEPELGLTWLADVALVEARKKNLGYGVAGLQV